MTIYVVYIDYAQSAPSQQPDAGCSEPLAAFQWWADANKWMKAREDYSREGYLIKEFTT